jgi:hypothetical protein
MAGYRLNVIPAEIVGLRVLSTQILLDPRRIVSYTYAITYVFTIGPDNARYTGTGRMSLPNTTTALVASSSGFGICLVILVCPGSKP